MAYGISDRSQRGMFGEDKAAAQGLQFSAKGRAFTVDGVKRFSQALAGLDVRGMMYAAYHTGQSYLIGAGQQFGAARGHKVRKDKRLYPRYRGVPAGAGQPPFGIIRRRGRKLYRPLFLDRKVIICADYLPLPGRI